MMVEIGQTIRHIPTGELIVVERRARVRSTGRILVNGRYPLCECEDVDPERDLSDRDVRQVAVCIEQMIDSGIYELDLLSVFNDRQRRQIWAALSIEQRECLKRAKESQDASGQSAA